MGDKLDCGELVPWLVETAAYFSREFFDGMPPVTFTCAEPKDCRGIVARYIYGKRVVEFSPGFIIACWRNKRRFWDLGKLWRTLLHEMVHAWVDWKGLSSNFKDGHNEWFLWKAHTLGLDLTATRAHYGDELIELHEEVKRGWNPNYMTLAEWREFAAALEGWYSKSWKNLLSDIRVVERIEERVPDYAWPAFVGELSGAYPFALDYKVIKDVKTFVPADLMYWVAEALEGWNTPVYELIKDLRERGGVWLTDLVAIWRDAIWYIQQWERASARSVLNELESLRDEDQEEIAAVVNRCEPLRRTLARVKRQVYDEIDWIKREAEQCGVGCSDDLDNLEDYSELNYSDYWKHFFDTYTFENFCKRCAV